MPGERRAGVYIISLDTSLLAMLVEYDMVDTNTNLDNNANVELISGVNYYDAVFS